MEEFRTQTATIRKLEANILETIVHTDAALDVDDIWAIKRANLEMCDQQPYAVLVDSGMYTSITEEGRKLSASKEFQQLTIAKALLVNSLAHKIVGRFYLKFNKPHISTKLFTDRDQAIQWLKLQVHQSRELQLEAQ